MAKKKATPKKPKLTKADKKRQADDAAEYPSPARGNSGTAGGAGRGVA